MTEALESLLEAAPGTRVYACGPTPMMRRCAEIARPVFRRLEREAALEVRHPHTGHDFSQPERDAAYRALREVLVGKES